MYNDDNGIYHIDNPKGCLLNLLLLVVALVICAVLGSCKSRQAVVRERYAVHDTVWSVRNDVSARRDSIVHYEFVNVRPHVLKLRDTTIVYMDTVINRSSVFNHYNNIFHSEDKGRITRDTAYIEKPVVKTVTQTVTKGCEFSWKTLLAGIIIGIALPILWKYRRKLWTAVKAVVKRVS